MSETNGTATVETNGTASEVNRITRKTKASKPKSKTKASKFAKLWASAYEHGDGGTVNGDIETPEGKVTIVVKTFPAAIDSETYTEAAVAEGCTATFKLGGQVVKGVKLKNAVRKLDGVGAEAFLDTCEEMYDAADEDDADE